ncbi:sensor histidine kinase [Mycolicibacterium arseniciresistens]|uniref:histidine kinase n=1 Tax=Mycolicibacterium arseniciresistens TaxID=3062257 RepID=A0ABT8UC45_9MYCO|nr:HAMP domain-containing sensor histidine kinase [Mycolicibacterium arseniciresistens]MDO3635342.1 HAMP domain-containing sensor histidine kinase [Mycolicibacterium arseniciresistens]
MTTASIAALRRRSRWSRRPGIGLRLLAAQAIVLVAGAATTSVVAAVVGPPLFREHLHRAGVPANSLEEIHAEEAYGYATVISIGGALAVSALAALAVSWYVSRRLQRSITEVSSAATAIADGHYGIRVSSPRLGDDFDALAVAFNEMASRLQAVETTRQHLFGDLAHEIRTPVAVLEAYVEALEDGVRALTPQTAAMLRDQTRRLVRFSEDVSALAKAEESSVSMTYDLIDVGRLADRCAAVAREPYADKGVALDVHVDGGLPCLWADEQRLAQVLGNLLDNSLRHTARGGCVEIRCMRVAEQVSISVVDSGEGVAAEHLPRLFERFYRADAARDRGKGGAGIGLAIAKALVEAHGGTITATSAGPGTGATFTLTMPTARRHDDAPATEGA